MKNTSFVARLGLFLWIVALVFIGWKVLFEPGNHTVVNHYLSGGERWVERIDLYTGPHGFIYMPLFASFFAMFTKLSIFWVDAFWRLILISLTFYGLFSLTRALCEKNKQSEHIWQWFGLVSLVALPIAFSGLRNGQMNVVLSAVMILVTARLIEERWKFAAVVLALVISLKPTFAVFFLLVAALYRPLWWRLPPLILLFLALPFAIAGLEYSVQQYLNFMKMSQEAMILGMEEPNWATFFNIAPQLFGFYVPDNIQVSIKIPLALLTLMLCYRTLRSTDPVTGAMTVLTLASGYHMLFNPRSVNTDYVIIGSVMAFWFAAATLLWKDKALAWMVGLNAFVILQAYELSKLVTPEHHSWVNPLAALAFTMLVLWQVRHGRRFVT